jgi:GxxExxY protein
MEGHDYRHAELKRRIIGVFFETYNRLGHGFLEQVDQKAMCVMLGMAGLRFESNVPLPVWFMGQQIGRFRADIVVEGIVLLEIKAAARIEPWHEAQVMNYLRASDLEIGLILNFGPKAQFKRLVFSNTRKQRPPMGRSDLR